MILQSFVEIPMLPSPDSNSDSVWDATKVHLSNEFVHVHRFSFSPSFWGISIDHLSGFIHIKTFTIILALSYLSMKVQGRCIFIKSEILWHFAYCSIGELYCCDITQYGRVPPEMATYKNSMKVWKIITLDWNVQICSNIRCWVSKIVFHPLNQQKCLEKLLL